MDLYPAIDIRDGRAVRLTQGDYEREQVYGDDPVEVAAAWVEQGARRLHVIDLDGARAGEPLNLSHVHRISTEAGVPVQFGGGLRTREAVDSVLQAGAARVVIGTKAQSDPDFLADLVTEFGEDRVVVGVDTRDGLVAVSGWTEATGVTGAALIEQMVERGARRFIFTPVERDGMLEGPGLDDARAVAEAVDGELIYSGGVGSLADLEALVAARIPNVTGVIVGKALYEGRFTVGDAHAVLDSA